MAHLLLVLLAVVRLHVDDEEPPARPQHAAGLGERERRLGDVVQDEDAGRGVERAVVDRQRLEPAAPQIDVGVAAQTPARGLQHRRGVVDADDSPHARRERLDDLPAATAEVADDRRVVEQPE